MLEFLKELKDFLLLNLNDYSNIEINFPIIIFLFLFAISLSAIFFVINARNMNSIGLIKQLLRHEAYGEDSAKTLSQLKVKNGFILRSMLSEKSGRLNSVVCRVGDKKMTYEEYIKLSSEKNYKEEKIDFSSALFYIPSDKQDTAKRMVDRDTSSVLKPILISILVLALFSCAAIVTPDLLSYINRALGK